ncbi:hypothetical protein MK904_13680 [Loigolactobacillus coryniformis]|uniref:hypothetical protein n=1 Tax=Loigolactobacillus coryniformis TaxID=1610 RepID=UPI0023405D0E|nr:hypothetical protein [Loigolactobacillus coryniformis]MDC4187117.1 hypothetical protein [Loigolactobacillus coryniformis]
MKIVKVLLAGSILLGGIAAPLPSISGQQSYTVQAAKSKIVIQSNKSVKRAIKRYAKDVKIKSVQGSFLGQNDTVQITLKGKENLTNKMTVKGMYIDISNVWKALQKTDLSHMSNIGISVKYPLQDQAGNSTSSFVIKSNISPDKINAINPDTFLFENVPTYADTWWQHTALPSIE